MTTSEIDKRRILFYQEKGPAYIQDMLIIIQKAIECSINNPGKLTDLQHTQDLLSRAQSKLFQASSN